jgi:hypothetical protein
MSRVTLLLLTTIAFLETATRVMVDEGSSSLGRLVFFWSFFLRNGISHNGMLNFLTVRKTFSPWENFSHCEKNFLTVRKTFSPWENFSHPEKTFLTWENRMLNFLILRFRWKYLARNPKLAGVPEFFARLPFDFAQFLGARANYPTDTNTENMCVRYNVTRIFRIAQ